MALQQPASANFWSEAQSAGAGAALDPVQFVDDGTGQGYKIESISLGNPAAARMLANATGGFDIHDGAANPSALAELRMVDDGQTISTYE